MLGWLRDASARASRQKRSDERLPVGLGAVEGDHLHGDIAVEGGVVAAPDGAEAAATDPRRQLVAIPHRQADRHARSIGHPAGLALPRTPSRTFGECKRDV